jgi:hypothetical protein
MLKTEFTHPFPLYGYTCSATEPNSGETPLVLNVHSAQSGKKKKYNGFLALSIKQAFGGSKKYDPDRKLSLYEYLSYITPQRNTT